MLFNTNVKEKICTLLSGFNSSSVAMTIRSRNFIYVARSKTNVMMTRIKRRGNCRRIQSLFVCYFVCVHMMVIFLREDLLASRQRAGGLMFGCTSLAIPHGRAEPRSIKHVHIAFFLSFVFFFFFSFYHKGWKKRGSSFLFRVGGALSGYATTRAPLMMRPLPPVHKEEKGRMKNIRIVKKKIIIICVPKLYRSGIHPSLTGGIIGPPKIDGKGVPSISIS